MRAAGLLLMIGYGALTAGAAYAAQAVVASQQASPPSAANTVGNHSRETEHATATDGGTHPESLQMTSKAVARFPATSFRPQLKLKQIKPRYWAPERA